MKTLSSCRFKIGRVALAGILIVTPTVMPAAMIEVMPMIGYQFNGSEDLAGPRNDRLDFRSVPLRGISIGYMNDDNGELELSWVRSFSAAQVQQSEGRPPDQFDVRMDQIHLNGLFMLDNSAFQPFGLLGLGATRYSPSVDLATTTKFSFSVGGGVKWLWTDHIGLRVEGLWSPSVAFRGSHFFCDEHGGGCYTTETNNYASLRFPFLQSFEFIGGLLLRY